MVQITLIRHGIAEDKTLGQSDFDRALTDTGCQKFLKRLLKHRNSLDTIDTIICSPSLRTRQTCALLCSIISVQGEDIVYDQRIYTFENDYELLLKLVDEYICDNKHLCLIGHNNSISVLASYLAGQEIVMKKGEIRSYNL